MFHILFMIKLEDIFVGRQKELAMLERIWRDTLDMRHEHKAYVIFNSPGVGKTTLIRKFGQILEDSGKGIHFNYVCNKRFTTKNAFHQNLLYTLLATLKEKKEIILQYINANKKNEDIAYTKKNFEAIYSREEDILNKQIEIEDIINLLGYLSRIIPIFYSSDEIQHFKKYDFTDGENILRYYSDFIKSFLGDRILLILTGTQYHILRELGDKIASPLKGKISAELISPLREEDITEYCNILRDQLPNNTSLDYLEAYLQTFSGGHGRTIYNIVKEFLDHYDDTYRDIRDYNDFQEELTDNLLEILVELEITEEKKEEIKKLQSNKYFDYVRQWINRGLATNLNLGRTERLSPASSNYEKNSIVYKFMTIGIITQNGNNNYYITSYFHYLTFLELIIGEYESFLREVLYNKHFRSLVGGHSGFGYNFENVILATLIINSNKIENFPLQISKIEQISRKINYANLHLQAGLLYHTPMAPDIDALTLVDETVTVFQITTQRDVTQSKVDKFHAELDKIKLSTKRQVIGWFISLFPMKINIPQNMKIIQGTDLIEFIGKNIYEKLIEIKIALYK